MIAAIVFAHAGETHDTSAAVSTPSILSTWYVALPLFIMAVVLVTVLTYYASRKSKPVTYSVLLGLLFIAGVATYTVSAPVSVLSLSLGFALALLQVLSSLSREVS